MHTVSVLLFTQTREDSCDSEQSQYGKRVENNGKGAVNSQRCFIHNASIMMK